MKKRITAFVLSLMMLVNPYTMTSYALEETSNSPGVIDLDTKFDLIMFYIDWLSLYAEDTDVLQQYINKYIEEHPEEFVDIVNDIVSSIDDYSYYMPYEQYSSSFSNLTDYVGIGITMQTSVSNEVVGVFTNGPAYRAGIKVGDLIIEVDGISFGEGQSDEIISMLLGEEGTNVVVTVVRDDETIEFTITREKINQEYVSNQTLAQGIEYISVTSMGSESDTQKFVNIWNSLESKNTEAVILDLRGNGGGLIDMAQRMIEVIMPSEGELFLQLRYREDGKGLESYYTTGEGFELKKLVVLVDGNSASASEIVAGSLQDLGAATLIGTQTYGKGVGQYHLTMPDGSKLILTSLEMLLPTSGYYNEIGLTPNIIIEYDGVAVDASIELSPIDTQNPIMIGDTGDNVYALTERLALLGYLSDATDVYDLNVQSAMHSFYLASCQQGKMFATTEIMEIIDEQATSVSQNAAKIDNQLATALEICKLAIK